MIAMLPFLVSPRVQIQTHKRRAPCRGARIPGHIADGLAYLPALKTEAGTALQSDGPITHGHKNLRLPEK